MVESSAVGGAAKSGDEIWGQDGSFGLSGRQSLWLAALLHCSSGKHFQIITKRPRNEPDMSLLRMYSKDSVFCHTDHMFTHAHLASRTWERPKHSPADERRWKCGAYTQFYSAVKKSELMKLAGTRMELENVIPSEVTQTQEDKHCWVLTHIHILASDLQMCAFNLGPWGF